MDFNKSQFEKNNNLFGSYTSLLIPQQEERKKIFDCFYLAFSKLPKKQGKTSGKVHNNVRKKKLFECVF